MTIVYFVSVVHIYIYIHELYRHYNNSYRVCTVSYLNLVDQVYIAKCVHRSYESITAVYTPRFGHRIDLVKY